jgi:predicted anti-sigma-YlaC factor YlaD
MTCRDCELLLSQDEIPATVQEHLNECAPCRSLAEEISANAAVLREFRDETLPFRAAPVLPAARPSWKWAALVPAFVVLVAVLLRWNTPDTAVAPGPLHAVTQKPLMVKMLTSDPNVVIYWQIDPNDQEQ